MKFKFQYLLLVAIVLQTVQLSCKKKGTPETPVAKTFQLQRVELDGALVSSSMTKEVGRQPKITLSFSAPLNRAKVVSSMVLGESATNRSSLALTYLKND
jgi:hypothetical protein